MESTNDALQTVGRQHAVTTPMESLEPERVSARQGRFIRYLFYVHIDLCVLGLFAQYWDRIYVESFTVGLLTAAVLQLLLSSVLALEHRIGAYFTTRPGRSAIVGRLLVTWLLLFSSKFVILEVVDVVFGDRVELGGLFPFIALSIALVVTERVVARGYKSLT